MEIKYSRSFGKYMFQLSPFNLQVHYFHDHCLSQLKEKILWFCINVFLSKLVTFFDSTYFLVFSKEILENLILFQSVRILEILKFPKFLEIANKCPILLVVRHFTGSERCFYQLLFLEFHKFISKISTW